MYGGSFASQSAHRLDQYCSPVAEDFGYALHDLGCIIAQSNQRIGAECSRVSKTLFERILPRFLAEVCQDRDVSADERLQTSSDGAEDGTGANDNPANHSERFYNPITFEFESGGGH